MPKKNFWNSPSKYGTYTGEKGSPEEWSKFFNDAFNNSEIVNSVMDNSAYSVLGLQVTATIEEIKLAFRQIIKKHNPDHANSDRSKFENVVNAYKKLLAIKTESVHENKEIVSDYVNEMKSNRKSKVQKTEAKSDESIDQEKLIVPQLLTQIDEDELTRYLFDNDFCCQEKMDGKHLTLQIKDGQFFVRNKKGIPSTLSEFENDLRVSGVNLLIDGEQVKTKFFVWDILELDGQNLRNQSYQQRYNILSTITFGSSIHLVKMYSGDCKLTLYNDLFERKKEGIVFKRLSAIFSEGKGNDQFKFKFYSECSVIVVEGRKNKVSIGMELIGPNGREFVGYCSCSRKLPIGSIAEIKYLYAYRDGCLYQPAFKEVRDDVDINECTLSQLKYKSED